MKVGNRVRIGNKSKSLTVPIPLDYIGTEGIIVAIEEGYSSCSGQQYMVQIKDVSGTRWFCEGELEVIKWKMKTELEKMEEVRERRQTLKGVLRKTK